MTKAYLMGFIACVAGKGVRGDSNPWWNPYFEEAIGDADKAAFAEFVRGWKDAGSGSNGMVDILKLAKG